MTYLDVLSIYATMRAGYIPQLFSLRLPNPDMIFELLQKANAKALIYDQALAVDVSQCPVPVHGAIPDSFTEVEGDSLPPLHEGRDEDVVLVLHTSGSTSGSPKLIPCNYRWFDCIVHKAGITSRPRTTGRPDVTVWM